MKISLELFDDCSEFQPDQEMTAETKGLLWTINIDGIDVSELMEYKQSLIDCLNVIMTIEGKFSLKAKESKDE